MSSTALFVVCYSECTLQHTVDVHWGCNENAPQHTEHCHVCDNTWGGGIYQNWSTEAGSAVHSNQSASRFYWKSFN